MPKSVRGVMKEFKQGKLHSRWVAVIVPVFGDESADETTQRVFAVGGVVGTEEHWEALERSWLARCEGIKFHAKDCESDQGDFASRAHRQNKDLYRDLSIMLAESGLGAWGFMIDLAAQRRVFPEAPNIAYYKCFLEVVEKMKNFAANNGVTVKFTFDMRKESAYNTGLLYGMFTNLPEWERHMFPEVGFACSSKQPRLQAADLFSHEIMKAYDNAYGPVKRPMRKSWKALYDTGRFHGEAINEGWFQSLKEQLPALEKQCGMSEGDYVQWLKDNHLQHNTTNMFLYMDWTARRDKDKS